jgi:hypothetical protein
LLLRGRAGHGRAEPPRGCEQTPSAPPPCPYRRRAALAGRNHEPTTFSVQFAWRTSRDNSTKARGLSAHPKTHVNSTA